MERSGGSGAKPNDRIRVRIESAYILFVVTLFHYLRLKNSSYSRTSVEVPGFGEPHKFSVLISLYTVFNTRILCVYFVPTGKLAT